MSKHHDAQGNQADQDIQAALDEAVAKAKAAAGEPAEDNPHAKIAELEAQLKEEQLRAAATVQNLNRRHQEEIQAAHKFAAAGFAKEMLPVKDYLEMALQDQSGNFDALKVGVEMTLKQLVTAFGNAHVSEINPVGETLDPNKHQAMSTEASDAAANTVIRVMQKGYALNDRILRPALVVVSAAKEA
ncbi:MAG: nucleotide exchange factor GrpE [Neisseria sp.]|nr:nucleotide exchange factor GrpE [Neisseria sp.]